MTSSEENRITDAINVFTDAHPALWFIYFGGRTIRSDHEADAVIKFLIDIDQKSRKSMLDVETIDTSINDSLWTWGMLRT